MHRQPRLTRNKHTQDKCLLCWFLCVCSSKLIQWSEEEIVQQGFKQHRLPLSFHPETNLAYRSGKTSGFFQSYVWKVSVFVSNVINMINLNRGKEQDLLQKEHTHFIYSQRKLSETAQSSLTSHLLVHEKKPNNYDIYEVRPTPGVLHPGSVTACSVKLCGGK